MIGLLIAHFLLGVDGADPSFGRWATCSNGEPADLRRDIPIAVLSEPATYEIGWQAPFMTGFVLYADGVLIARRDLSLRVWNLLPQEFAGLKSRLALDHLADLEDQYDRTTESQRSAAKRSFHYQIPVIEVTVWKQGCSKRIRILGLSQFATTKALGGLRSMTVESADLKEALRILNTLPPELAGAIREMLAERRFKSGKTWADIETGFSRDRALPYQELWHQRAPDDRRLK